jgi:arylformamidase
MFIDMSYSLDPQVIVMPGPIDKPTVIKRSRMAAQPPDSEEQGVRWGSYNNTSNVHLFAHTGTHIDTPFHVDPEGFKLHEFTLQDFIFEHPVLLEIPKGDCEKISVADLEPYADLLAQADALLTYTSYSRIRNQEPDRFVAEQPGLSVEAANYLVDNFTIRAFGIDTLGIENISEGKNAEPTPFPVHKTLLLKKKQKTLLIEDLNMVPALGKKLLRLFVIPLRLHGMEAMPVTAFAEIEG